MGTKANPARFDCWREAKPDEPMFILLARDVEAPELVLEWADRRVRHGKNREDDDQIVEARECALAMIRWRDANPPRPRGPRRDLSER